MMREIARVEMLNTLEMAVPGLSMKARAEQSNCFIFHDGKVQTFNDEVSCICKFPLPIVGAVPAKPLLELLRKLEEEFIEVWQTKAFLKIKGKGRSAGIRMEREIFLNLDDLEAPKGWKKLEPTFTEGTSLVRSCCSKDEQQFVLTCVHIHPDWVEACDQFQAARMKVKTGFKKSVLMRGRSAAALQVSDVSKISASKSWIHFSNGQGFTISCRKHIDEYPNIEGILNPKGKPIVIPKGVASTVDIAEVFTRNDIDHNYLQVSLKNGMVRMRGEGMDGYFSETKKVKYKGEPMTFRISPSMLGFIVKHGNKCRIEEGKLKLINGDFIYVTCLEAPEPKEEKK